MKKHSLGNNKTRKGFGASEGSGFILNWEHGVTTKTRRPKDTGVEGDSNLHDTGLEETEGA